ncbi:MAG: GTP-binding protein [Thermoplasmata archaeon]|nr:MAG: GTP-binding protein [Thermoplasmata archaeon]
MNYEIEVKKKIILLGDGAVGKTSLIKRFVIDKFDDKYILSIGTKVTGKTIKIEREQDLINLKFQIWDILGQKGFTKLHQSSFRGTDGVILVADITRKKTLLSLATYWIPKVHHLVGNVPFIILANKYDLKDDAEFGEEELKKFSAKYNASYYFTSAKNGENVHKAFFRIGHRMLEVMSEKSSSPVKHGIIHPRLLFDGEKSGIIKLIDKIIDDFCRDYGELEEAMPVLRRQFEIAGLDLSHPSKVALKRAVHRLAQIELDHLSMEIAEENQVRRLKWIKEFGNWT